ncbi:unnamed protein product, partial [Adineta steineri]
TPDLLQLPTLEKFNEQIQNLNLVIDTYKNESKLLKNELQKLYTTIEHNKITSQQYEKRFKDQQISFEQLKNLLQKYEQIIQKHNLHIPIFDERKEHLMNPTDEYIIDLDIDIIQGNNKKKTPLYPKRNSPTNSVIMPDDYQQQITKKDREIQKLSTDFRVLEQSYADLKHHYETEGGRNNQNIVDDLKHTQDELNEIRRQYKILRTQNTGSFQDND